jgi:hypothetical protein
MDHGLVLVNEGPVALDEIPILLAIIQRLRRPIGLDVQIDPVDRIDLLLVAVAPVRSGACVLPVGA